MLVVAARTIATASAVRAAAVMLRVTVVAGHGGESLGRFQGSD